MYTTLLLFAQTYQLYIIIKFKLTGGSFEPKCIQRAEITFPACEWEEVAREPWERTVLYSRILT
jgi:hypothetical protein